MKKVLGLIFLAALLFVNNSLAATTPNSVITVQTPTIGVTQFLQGTDTAGTYKTVYTGGTNGSKIVSLTANTNDGSAAHLITCEIKTGSVNYGGTAVNVPLSSGFATSVPPVNLMSSTNWPGLPIDSDGNPFIYLPSSSYTLVCTYATSLTSGKVANVQVVAGDF